MAFGLLLDLVVVEFLGLVADHADEAFVQNGVAGGRRTADAVHAREIVERDRLAGLVLDRVLHREQIFVVDRNDALEDEALAVVPGERQRLAGGKLVRIGRPQRLGRGQNGRVLDLAGHEAHFGVIGRRAEFRRQQRDDRARRVDGLAIVLERDVVEAGALQRDGAGNRARVDRNARAQRKRLLAGSRDRRRRRRGCRLVGRAELRRLGEARLLGLRLFLAVKLRESVEIIPQADENQRERRGDEHVLGVFSHGAAGLSFRLRRWFAA